MEDVRANLSQTWDLLMTRKILFVWMFFAILGNVLQALFLRKSGIALPEYSYFILWSTVIPFLIAFWIAFLVLRAVGRIKKEECHLPWNVCIPIGTFTALNGFFMLFANPHVPGTLQALLGPAIVTIPMTMVLSFFYLRKRFNKFQLISCTVIFVGLVISILPDLKKDNFSNVPKNKIPQIVWDLIFFLGSAPLSMATVLQENVFVGKSETSVCYMMAMILIPQTIVLFAVAPFDFIPEFGSSTTSNFLQHQLEGMKCGLLGDGSGVVDGPCPQCRCDIAPTMYWLFVLGYLMANFSNVGVVKNGSATLLFIVISVTAPLTTIVFSLDFAMRPFVAERHDDTIWIALVIILFGVMGYMVFEPAPSKTEPHVVFDDDDESKKHLINKEEEEGKESDDIYHAHHHDHHHDYPHLARARASIGPY
eukprot:PhM_4_TR3520/c0_g1_i1/m.16868